MDFPLRSFHHHSPPTGGGLVSGSGHFRKVLAKVQGGVPRLTFAQFDLQRVGLCTTVGRECPDFNGMSGTNRGNMRLLHPRAPISQPRGRAPKGCATKDGTRNSPSSSPDRGGADSDGYSMVSEVLSTHHCRRRWHGEK